MCTTGHIPVYSTVISLGSEVHVVTTSSLLAFVFVVSAGHTRHPNKICSCLLDR